MHLDFFMKHLYLFALTKHNNGCVMWDVSKTDTKTHWHLFLVKWKCPNCVRSPPDLFICVSKEIALSQLKVKAGQLNIYFILVWWPDIQGWRNEAKMERRRMRKMKEDSEDEEDEYVVLYSKGSVCCSQLVPLHYVSLLKSRRCFTDISPNTSEPYS